jgi:hypothetical protein
VRDANAPSHVVILATLGAPERRRMLARRSRTAPPEPDPAPVPTTRATVVDVGDPLPGQAEAAQWLGNAGEGFLDAGLLVLNQALYAHRLVSADPYARPVARGQPLVARIGFGAGEQVAEGRWADARELVLRPTRSRRVKALHPQARMAEILAGGETPLVCEDLSLRARLDLDLGHDRAAALQVLIALDAALAELAGDHAVTGRLDELRLQRTPIAAAAQSALAGPLDGEELETVAATLGRIEAALRARAAVGA